MSKFKKLLLFVLSFVLRFSLIFGLTILAVVLLLGSPKGLKQSLDETNAQQRFSDALVKSAVDSNTNELNSLPFDRPEVVAALQKAVSTKTITNISDSIIESSYDWLNGQQASIKFKVDLRQNKQVFANDVASYATHRLNQLPQCFSPTNADVFRVDCYPYGLNLVDLKDQVKELILNNDIIVKDDVITQDILPKKQGLTIDQQYPNAPAYFKLIKLAPYLLLGLSVLSALTIIFIARTKRSGLKMVGSMVLSSAIFLAITPLIYVYVLPMIGFKMPELGAGSDQNFSTIFSDISSNLYSQLNVYLINIGIQVAVVGAVMLIVARFMKSNANAYVNLDKKSGLTTSEKKQTRSKSTKNRFPIQTSEGPKKARKNVSKFEKKYRKM